MESNNNNLQSIAYIALGSNKGNKLDFIRKAIQEFINRNDCRVVSVSSVYETRPFGNIHQANFYNCAAEVRTSLSIIEFFYLLKKIEKELGRIKSERWGPREIDLDLLFFDSEIFKNDELKVPHDGIAFRDFVLIPLCEIAPNFIHPELNQKICDICNNEKNVIKKLEQKIF